MAQQTTAKERKLFPGARKAAHYKPRTEGVMKKLGAKEQARIEKQFFELVKQGDKRELDYQISRLEKSGIGIKPIINARDTDGRTALMFAAAMGQTKLCILLVNKGADANMENKFGWTASMVAGHYGHGETAESLKSMESKEQ
jgi:ankyrin repeat protein